MLSRKHEFSVEEVDQYVETVRELNIEGKSYTVKKRCPEEGCKAKFSKEEGLRDHRMEKHPMQAIDNETQSERMKDRLPYRVDCRKCVDGDAVSFKRISHLARHLVTVHRMSEKKSIKRARKWTVRHEECVKAGKMGDPAALAKHFEDWSNRPDSNNICRK